MACEVVLDPDDLFSNSVVKEVEDEDFWRSRERAGDREGERTR